MGGQPVPPGNEYPQVIHAMTGLILRIPYKKKILEGAFEYANRHVLEKLEHLQRLVRPLGACVKRNAHFVELCQSQGAKECL